MVVQPYLYNKTPPDICYFRILIRSFSPKPTFTFPKFNIVFKGIWLVVFVKQAVDKLEDPQQE